MLGILPAYANYGLENTQTPIDCITIMHENGTRCFSYLPSLEIDNSTQQYQKSAPALNWSMDIHGPNWTCNITGKTLNNGDCSAPSIVLSNDDLNNLRNNISVLAVKNIQMSGMPAQNYCPVAIWTWSTQDDVFKTKYNESLVVPSYCNSTPVPEFGPVASIVLAIAVMSMVVFVAKTRGIPKF